MFKKNPDHIYYDLQFGNVSDKLIPMSFTQSRSSDIITNPEDYYVSVIRFTIPNKTIPIFRWPTKIVNNVEVADNTQFSVTITLRGAQPTNTIQQFLVFNQTEFIEGYDPFGIYSYNNFLLIVNNTLYNIWKLFDNLNTNGIKSPFFRYQENGLIALYMGISDPTTNNRPNTNDIDIYLNHTLQTQYFQNFEGINLGINQTLGKDFQLPTYSHYSGHTIAPSFNNVTTFYVIWTQEVSCIASWNAIRALIIQSSKLPTRSDLLNGSSIESNSETTNNVRQLITDFEPAAYGQESRSRYQYFPQGEYRLLDMMGNQPINEIDINVLWEDKFQKLHQVYLDVNSFLSIKLLFISKDFYRNKKIENLEWIKEDKKLIKY